MVSELSSVAHNEKKTTQYHLRGLADWFLSQVSLQIFEDIASHRKIWIVKALNGRVLMGWYVSRLAKNLEALILWNESMDPWNLRFSQPPQEYVYFGSQ